MTTPDPTTTAASPPRTKPRPPVSGWVTVSIAATFTGRPPRTVWQWITDGLVSCRRNSEDRVEVWFFDVFDLAQQQPTRRRPRMTDKEAG